MIALLVAAALQVQPPQTAKQLYKLCASYQQACYDFMASVRAQMPEACDTAGAPASPSMMGQWLVDTGNREGDSMVDMTADQAARKALSEYLQCAPRVPGPPHQLQPRMHGSAPPGL